MLTMRTCFLAVLYLLVASWSYGQTPTPGVSADKPNKQNTDPQEKPEADQRGTDKTPFIIKVLPSQPSEPPPAPHTNQEKQKTTDWDWWSDKSPEILIALFTLFLWLATRRLVKGADETAERQLRPYVALHITAEGYPPSAPDRFAVYLVVTNAGKTWARHLKIQFAMIPQEYSDGSDPFDLMEKNISLSPMILGPGQSLKLQFGDIAPPVVLAVANKLFQRSYVAVATYKDTLSPSVIIRQTQISCRLNGDLQGGVSFSYMPTHNCADEDCPQNNLS
jgi:hypothetical protein